jgi:hypothetical protein
MWKRHPLTHSALALFIIIVALTGIGITGAFDASFWEDTHATPRLAQGTIEHLRAATYSTSGHFDLVSSQCNCTFEANILVTRGLNEGQKVEVSYSPNLLHLYQVQILEDKITPSLILTQDFFAPGALFQSFQTINLFVFLFLLIIAITSSIYAILALLDWFLNPKNSSGIVIVRPELAEYESTSMGSGLIVRPFGDKRKSLHFYVSQANLRKIEAAQLVAVTHTPIFNYVKQIRTIQPIEVPLDFYPLDPAELERYARPLHNLSRWQLLLFVGSDLAGGIALLSLPLAIAAVTFSHWTDEAVTSHYQLVLLPSVGTVMLCLSGFMLLNFLRKWQDMRRPKKLTEGPVLSKWRINGESNENRRQIVVADGGLDNDSAAVRKFDISAQIFDELKVGDVVKIEHTPRFRFILCLEVVGYQELIAGQ